MRRRGRFLAGIIASLGGAALLAGCHGRGHWGSAQERADHVTAAIADRLDFSDEQKKKLDVIKKDVMAKFSETKADRESFHKEASTMLCSDTIDRKAVIGMINWRIESLNRNKEFIADQIVAFHSILNAKQKKAIAEHIEKRFNR